MSAFFEFKDVKKIYQMGEVKIEALAGVNLDCTHLVNLSSLLVHQGLVRVRF